MTTSSFVRFGEKAEHILNIAQISSIWKEDQIFTERELTLDAYKNFPLHGEKGNKAYSICISAIGSKPQCYIYLTEAVRDASFEKMAAVLEPLIISKVELADVIETMPAPSNSIIKKPRKNVSAEGNATRSNRKANQS